MQKQHLGYPRTGSNRELKKACDNHLFGKISVFMDSNICLQNYKMPKDAETDLILLNGLNIDNQVSDVPLFYVRIA